MADQKIETLSFSIGGFHAGWEQIIWHENKLQHQFFQHIYPEHIKIPPDKIYSETVPLEKDWEIFWKEIEKSIFYKIHPHIEKRLKNTLAMLKHDFLKIFQKTLFRFSMFFHDFDDF